VNGSIASTLVLYACMLALGDARAASPAITITPSVYALDSLRVIRAVIKNESSTTIRVRARSGKSCARETAASGEKSIPILLATSPSEPDPVLRTPMIRTDTRGWLPLRPGQIVEAELVQNDCTSARQVAVVAEDPPTSRPLFYRSRAILPVEVVHPVFAKERVLAVAESLGFDVSIARSAYDEPGRSEPHYHYDENRVVVASSWGAEGPRFDAGLQRCIWILRANTSNGRPSGVVHELWLSALTGAELCRSTFVWSETR
jgi:hypothetical protein